MKKISLEDILRKAEKTDHKKLERNLLKSIFIGAIIAEIGLTAEIIYTIKSIPKSTTSNQYNNAIYEEKISKQKNIYPYIISGVIATGIITFLGSSCVGMHYLTEIKKGGVYLGSIKDNHNQ